MNNYTPIIGLEVHVELKTNSKMFCGCSADYFGKQPNTHTCPVCLGLPGALPVPNKTAIEWCIKIALALNCKINEFSKFDRKNYFYPDLAKGYQISQYDLPFGYNGSITLSHGKTIRIRRVHMEEDTGKLTHTEGKSLIDFNRSGLPLVEIVTEPDFHNAQDVTEYLQKLQQIVRYLDVSNADMEKGDMRLEPNISLKPVILGSNATLESKKDAGQASMTSEELPPYKVEVKNINSFRFVAKAIEFEIKRQSEILDKGETPAQETRGYDSVKQRTVSQRSKEEAQDYRYFPEPDIPPIRIDKSQIESFKSEMPEMPNTKRERFAEEYDLPAYDAEILTRERPLADYFEEVVTIGNEHKLTPKQIANWVINKKINPEDVLPAKVIKQMLAAKQKVQVDEKELEQMISEVVAENEKAVTEYKNGKETVIMFLVGQVMKKVGKKIDAQMVKEKLQKHLQDTH